LRGSRFRGVSLLGAAAAVLLSASLASADTRSILLTADECDGLSAGEVERLLAIELASALSQDAPPLGVSLACEGTKIRIVAVDPVTDKRLEREIELRQEKGQKDRVVALVVSQLFLTSWAELLLPRPPQIPPPRAPPPPEVVRRVETATRSALVPAAAWDWDVAVLGGARVRSWEAPLFSGWLGVRPAIEVGRLRFFVELAYEEGSRSGPSGTVSVSLATPSLGVGWRAVKRDIFVLDLDLSGGASWVQARGSGASSSFDGGAGSGSVGDVELGVAPGARLGPVEIRLDLSAGYSFPRAVVHAVSENDVTLSGPWGSAGLAVGLAERAR